MAKGQKESVKVVVAKRPPRTSQAPGQKVRLLTNLFKMSLKQEKPIYHYGVSVQIETDIEKSMEGLKVSGDKKGPRKIPGWMQRKAVDEAIRKWLTNNSPKNSSKSESYNYVTDSNGSVVFALFELTKGKSKCELEIQDIAVETEDIVGKSLQKVQTKFSVKFSPVKQMNIKSLFDYCLKNQDIDTSLLSEQIRALNIILRAELMTIPINVFTLYNVFPYTPENQTSIGPTVLINKGYSISVKATELGPAVNIANTVAAFHKPVYMTDMLKDQFRVRDFSKPLNRDTLEQLKREVRNKQVEATHINYGSKQDPRFRKYRITDIAGSSEDKFMLVDKTTNKSSEITIAKYFETEYKLKLKYPKLPCIINQGRKIPLELCRLVDKQRVMRKMDPQETSEIIRIAAVKPVENFQRLKTNVDEIHDKSKPLQKFGLTFEPKPIEVEGRELKPTRLLGASRKPIAPMDGQYNNMDRFVKPAVIKKWVLAFIVDEQVSIDGQRGNFEKFSSFSQKYCNGGQIKGVTIPPADRTLLIPPDKSLFERLPENQAKDMLKKFFNMLNDSKYDHSIIVLPKRCPDWLYGYIQYLEVSCKGSRKLSERWTRTSCIKYDNFTKKIIFDRFDGKMFIANLWLKHNTKLGGVNFVLEGSNDRYLSNGYIFISVDVCHPAPGDKLIQSVAAVVGMWDLTNPSMSYCTRVRTQKKVRENQSTIEDVGEIDLMIGQVLDSYLAKKKKLPSNIVILRDGVSQGQYQIVLNSEISKVKALLFQKYNQKPPTITCLVVQKRHKVKFMRVFPHKTPKGDDYNIQPGTVVDSGIIAPQEFSFYMAPHKAIQGTSRPPHIDIILDENNFSQDEAQSMIHALSYLSPRCNKSTSIPTPVNLADLAAERGKNIVIGWNDDNRMKMSDDQRLTKLNEFLDKMGDSEYKNTLFYV